MLAVLKADMRLPVTGPLAKLTRSPIAVSGVGLRCPACGAPAHLPLPVLQVCGCTHNGSVSMFMWLHRKEPGV